MTLSFNIQERRERVLEKVCWAPFVHHFTILLAPHLLLSEVTAGVLYKYNERGSGPRPTLHSLPFLL